MPNAHLEIYVDGGCLNNGGLNPKAYGSIKVTMNGQPVRIGPGIWQKLMTFKPEIGDLITNTGMIRFEFPNLDTNNGAELASLLVAMHYISLMEQLNPQVTFTAVIKMDSNWVIGQVALGHQIKKAVYLRPLKDAAVSWWQAHMGRVQFDKVLDTEMKAVVGH